MKEETEHMEYDDDAPVGRVLSRREVLTLFAGFGGAVLLAACDPLQAISGQPASTATPTPTGSGQTASASTATPLSLEAATATNVPVQETPTTSAAAQPSCVVRPEETEGPYFVDEKLNRSDIRSDPSDGSVKEGLTLLLAFRVSPMSNGCAPLAGAQVDVWHCDAMGTYSDSTDPGFNTVGKKFLRGYQVTDANGVAQFTTIYPGWYQGRTVHVHFKIRSGAASGKTYDFTSQLFFDDTVTDQVHAQQPYAAKGQRTLRNDGDNIYQNGGSQLMLPLTKVGQGYSGIFDIGLQMS
jgi:protocatechuate 3,4-dioxygenase beta subunit